MAGTPAADEQNVSSPRRARRRLLAAAVAVLAVAGAGSAGAAELGTDPSLVPTTTTTTTTSGDLSSTTTTPTDADSPPETTTTLAPPPGFAADEPLPPATPGLPPPELTDAPPPAVAPTPPPGADDAGRHQAAAALRAAQVALKAGQAALRARQQALLPVQKVMFAAQAHMATLDAQQRLVADALTEARTKVKRIAIAGYVSGGDSQPVDFLLRAKDPVDLERRRALVATATKARKEALAGYEVAQRQADGELDDAVRHLDEAQAAVDVAQAAVDDAAASVSLLQAAVDNAQQLLDVANATAVVLPTDIPRIYLDAYKRAAQLLARRQPLCHVDWPAIAALGRIESNHGRYAGTQVALNGDAYPRILGIPLDGTRSALVTDTDGGALDGDTTFDRAVGPMQFIPSTWVRIGDDGNYDGIVDPNNIYDAALSTASYLCRAVPTGGLDADDALRTAFFSYNHSQAYVDTAMLLTQSYRSMAASVS